MPDLAPDRPVMRYYGGKWRLAPWIIEHLPDHRIYVEPFGGAASVLIRKQPAYAEVYNDLAGEVVNLFEVLRDEDLAGQLEDQLRKTPYSRRDFRAAYEAAEDPVEQARRTLIKCYMGFGSSSMWREENDGMRTAASTWSPPTGFRSNSFRSGTTPASDWATYPDLIEDFHERLQGVVIENRPAKQVIQTHDRHDTLFYLDPPYLPEVRNTKHEYRHELSTDEHRSLAELLRGGGGGYGGHIRLPVQALRPGALRRLAPGTAGRLGRRGPRSDGGALAQRGCARESTPEDAFRP